MPSTEEIAQGKVSDEGLDGVVCPAPDRFGPLLELVPVFTLELEAEEELSPASRALLTTTTASYTLGRAASADLHTRCEAALRWAQRHYMPSLSSYGSFAKLILGKA